MTQVSKYILAIVIVIALAEFIPEAVNWILVLILAGIFLKQAGMFTGLFAAVGSLGK